MALDRLQPMDGAEILVFGDSPYDAEAAGKLGLHTVGMRCGGFADSDPQGAGAIALHRDPAHLLARIDEVMRLV